MNDTIVIGKTMASLTIELEERHLEQLRDEAARIGVSLEVYVRTTLMRSLANAEVQRTSVPQETFERAMAYTIEKNDELYKRLARG